MTDADPSEQGTAKRSSGAFAWAALGLAALHAVLGLVVFEPTLFPGGDNAGYLILGDALRGGEGYRDLYLPGSPLHAKYPPLLPAMLAVVGTFGGLQLAKLSMLACTTLAVWVTARWGRALVGEGPALLAASLLAVNPTLLEYGHYVLTEAPFVLLVLLALWAYERDSRTGAILAVVAAAGAFATRTAGLTILIALPITWLVRRRFRRAIWSGVAAVGVLAAWGVYQGIAAPDQPGYLQELVLIDPYDPDAGSVGLAGLIFRAAGNLWAYTSRVIPQAAIGAEGPPSGLVTGFGIVLAALAVAGWARRARTSIGALEIFVVLYAGLIAMWPEVWTDRRFLLPLLPALILLSIAFVAGLGPRIRRWAPTVFVFAIAFPSLLWVFERAPGRMDCAAAFRTGNPCDAPELASFYQAARWARDSTPEGAIIANRKPRLFYWHARRQGDLYPYSADPDVVMAGLERMGADYVVVDRVSGTTARYLVPAIQANAARFEPVYQGGSPPTFVFRILPAPTAAQ